MKKEKLSPSATPPPAVPEPEEKKSGLRDRLTRLVVIIVNLPPAPLPSKRTADLHRKWLENLLLLLKVLAAAFALFELIVRAAG